MGAANLRRRRAAADQYLAVGASFDGTNDYIEVNPSSNNADATRQVVSFWFRVLGGAGTSRYIGQAVSSRWYSNLAASDKIITQARNSSNTVIWRWDTTATFTDSNWHHIFTYMDTTGADESLLYIDGVADAGSIRTEIAGTMNLSVTRWSVGSLVGGSFRSPVDVAEWWMGDPGRAVTPDDVKSFIRGGKPVRLGTAGQKPFGVTPPFYLNGDQTDFHVNRGDGGNYAVTGALTSVQEPIRL